jgi:hypothetical protein
MSGIEGALCDTGTEAGALCERSWAEEGGEERAAAAGVRAARAQRVGFIV